MNSKDSLTSDAKKNSPSSVNSLRIIRIRWLKRMLYGLEGSPYPTLQKRNPLKNDLTKFEQQFDANNLDKNR